MEQCISPSELIKQGIKQAIEDEYKYREIQKRKDEIQETLKNDVVNYILNELQESIRTYPTQKEKWYMDILFNKKYLKDQIYDLQLKKTHLKHTYYNTPGYNTTLWDKIMNCEKKIKIYDCILNIIEVDTVKTTLLEHGYSITPYKVYKTFLWIPYRLVSDHRVCIKEAL